MGWSSFFSAKSASKDYDILEKVVAIDDEMTFDGNTYSYPINSLQNIFFSELGQTNFDLVKKEIDENFTDIIKILICKRKFPNGYGDMDLLLNSVRYIRTKSFDEYKQTLNMLAKNNLWKDLQPQHLYPCYIATKHFRKHYHY